MKTGITAKVQSLRHQLTNGDSSAAEDCRSEYGASIRRIVRHMLRTRCFSGELGELVRSLCDQLTTQMRLKTDELVPEICQRVISTMLGSPEINQLETIKLRSNSTVSVA